MVFSGITFLFYFLPIFLMVYYAAPSRFKNLVCLIGSILFYSWGAPKFVFVILGSTILDFYIVQSLHRSNDTKKRKTLLALSIFMNLGLLAYFKYANFFVDNVNFIIESTGLRPMKWVAVVLPIGISFYTFQTLTYSIDIYRRIHRPLDKLTDYLLYIMSFPQMIAGPIVRFGSIATEIVSRTTDFNDRLQGFYRFVIGLSKKVLIANVMGAQADKIINGDIQNLDSGQAWLGMLAYTFQIYFDFAGYSDMAIGLGRMMGFTFPENFNSPYTSRSITEFWRRWHMTLGSFMKDYLYIPLGGNRVSTKRMYFNLWLVFLLSGLWHGSSWNFVIWGAYHGLFLILDRLFLDKFYKKTGPIVSTFLTFFLVIIGWTIFRIEDLDSLSIYMGSMFNFSSFHLPSPTMEFNVIFALALLFSTITLSNPGRRLAKFVFENRSYNPGQHILMTTVTVILLFISVTSLTSSDFNPFIYFRF